MLFAKLELNYTRNYNRSSFSGEYCLLFIIAFLKKKKAYPVSMNSSLIHLLIVDTQAHEVMYCFSFLNTLLPKPPGSGSQLAIQGKLGSPFPLIQGTNVASLFWMSSISC